MLLRSNRKSLTTTAHGQEEDPGDRQPWSPGASDQILEWMVLLLLCPPLPGEHHSRREDDESFQRVEQWQVGERRRSAVRGEHELEDHGPDQDGDYPVTGEVQSAR